MESRSDAWLDVVNPVRSTVVHHATELSATLQCLCGKAALKHRHIAETSDLGCRYHHPFTWFTDAHIWRTAGDTAGALPPSSDHRSRVQCRGTERQGRLSKVARHARADEDQGHVQAAAAHPRAHGGSTAPLVPMSAPCLWTFYVPEEKFNITVEGLCYNNHALHHLYAPSAFFFFLSAG